MWRLVPWWRSDSTVPLGGTQMVLARALVAVALAAALGASLARGEPAASQELPTDPDDEAATALSADDPSWLELQDWVSQLRGLPILRDVPRVVDILRRAGYRGYVVLEYESKPDPYDAVPKHLAELRAALSKP